MAFKKSTFPPSSPKDTADQAFVPKLTTAASAITHALDSPSVSGTPSSDGHQLELDESEAEIASEKEFRYQERPLTEEETSGLFRMIAVVGALWGAAYLATPKKDGPSAHVRTMSTLR